MNDTPKKILITCVFLLLGGWGSTTIKIGGDENATKITNFVAKNFAQQDDSLKVDNSTSNDNEAFEEFCKDNIDLVNSSRPINAHEKKMCSENGTRFSEMIIGVNAIVVLVNQRNTVIHCLDEEQIRGIWGFEGRRHISSWKHLYQNTPEQAIIPLAPLNEDLNFMEANVLSHNNAMGDYEDIKIRGNVKTFTNVDEMLNYLYNDKYSIAFVSYSDYARSKEHFNSIDIKDEFHRCVQPNVANISKGKYKLLQKPLYVYYNTKTFSSGVEEEFISFYSHNRKKASEMAGYIPYDGE